MSRSVAEDLKNGVDVVAEKFECVTLLLSEIVGFTALCSVSSPLEVVRTLNDLYALYDGLIDKFDAYKVSR